MGPAVLRLEHATSGRWYTIHLQPTLFGAIDVVRRWGGQGRAASSERRDAYSSETAARLNAARIADLKARRGYREAQATATTTAANAAPGRRST
jgi:predicted DNA-binding WGR domain protein